MKEFFLVEDNKENKNTYLFLNEDVLNEGVYTLVKPDKFKKSSETIMDDMTKLVKMIEQHLKDPNVKKKRILRQLYYLNNKLKTRERIINEKIKTGDYASIVSYCVYAGDFKFMYNKFKGYEEGQKISGAIKDMLLAFSSGVLSGLSLATLNPVFALVSFAANGALTLHNVIVSRRIAETKEGIAQVKKYASFLKSMTNKIESIIHKNLPNDYNELKSYR